MPSKKHLILTYGVAPGRQRTLVLSLPRVNAVRGTGAVMALWSVGSVAYFLSAGFRTEAVVEATTLPAPATADAAALPEEMPSSPEEMASSPVGAPVPVESVVTPPEPTVAVEPLASSETLKPLTPQPETKAAEPELAATVENYRAVDGGNRLVTYFGIRNRSHATLRGKVKGEAEFVAADGSVQTIVAEQDYKARTLSAKQLAFAAPGPGKFTKVRIIINDRATQRAVVFFK
jgi:hypothetical protein